VSFTYSRIAELGTAATVQVARVTDGVPDWASPLATVTLRRSGPTFHSAQLADTFTDGEHVTIALRALTAGAVAGPVTALAPIVADATGPGHVDYLEVSQYA
jgi:hypothetical protein